MKRRARPEGARIRCIPGRLPGGDRELLLSELEVKTDGVVRWRRVDLKRVISSRFGVDYHERSIGKLLRKLGFSHMSARPRHPKQDERIVESFKNVWPAPSARGLIESAE